jgi:hypothetical protein
MIHWEWVEVQVSHTVSSVSHSMDTVVINDSLRVGWGTSLPHHVFCIVGDLYLKPLSMNHWSQQYPLNGIQKTWCGRFVPQPTLNESLITTVSIEWDTEDMVWEICTSTPSKWIIDHNTIHWMGYRRNGVGDLYPNPLSMNCIPFNRYCCDQWFIESGLRYKSPTPCLLYPIQ